MSETATQSLPHVHPLSYDLLEEVTFMIDRVVTMGLKRGRYKDPAAISAYVLDFVIEMMPLSTKIEHRRFSQVLGTLHIAFTRTYVSGYSFYYAYTEEGQPTWDKGGNVDWQDAGFYECGKSQPFIRKLLWAHFDEAVKDINLGEKSVELPSLWGPLPSNPEDWKGATLKMLVMIPYEVARRGKLTILGEDAHGRRNVKIVASKP